MDKDTLALATQILGEEEVASMRRSHRLPARKPVFGKPVHKLPPVKPVREPGVASSAVKRLGRTLDDVKP